MRLLLLLPRLEPNTNPPLGLAYIAAYVRQHGHEVEILDPTFEDRRFVEQRLSRADYDLLGVSVYTMNFPLGLEFARLAKRYHPSVKVLFGGSHATVLPEATVREDAVDFVSVGEGEETVLELLNALRDGTPLETVRGLVFKKEDGTVVRNPPRPLIKDLDALPFPARDLLPMERYLKANFGRSAWAVRQPATSIVTSRGCPFRCTYCSSHLTFGRTTRYRSPENIVAETEHLVATYGIRGLSIVDDTFIISKKHIYELTDLMRRRGLDLEFICNGRVDTIDKDILKALKDAGCVGIAFGVESGSQRILDEILKKGIRLEQVRNAFRWAWEVGIPTDAYFMMGIPGETEADIRETIRFSKTLRASAANFSITVPMPGTELLDIAKRYGVIEASDWSDYSYTSGKVVFRSHDIPPERLRRLRRQAVLSFYFDPRFLWNQLTGIRSYHDLVKKVKGFLMLLRTLLK